MNERRTLRTGLAVGGGTGPEVASVFERALRYLSALHGIGVEIVRSPRQYRTYGPVAAMTPADAARAATDDASHYVSFIRELAAADIRVCFRTAFNAQALYLVRDELLGVKIEILPHAAGDMILIRDETQGFYGGRNDTPANPEFIRRETVFSRENTRRVLDFAAGFAARKWHGARIDHFVVACKFHLLDSRFSNWVREYERERGITIHLWQPDTTNRQLLRGALGGRVLIVGANEWADIMHADLIARFGHGGQEERCSRNVYLDPVVEGFVEYQTVHGSADDIAGRDHVNPAATLRAAAGILEEFGGVSGADLAIHRALAAIASRGIATPDTGGRSSTGEVVAAALAELAGEHAQKPPELLVIVDMQNDFLAPDGRFAELGLITPAEAKTLATRVNELLAAWRKTRNPVVFVRTLADDKLLPPTLRERSQKTGRDGWLRPDSLGAGFFRVAPQTGETVFSKIAFDPFFDPQFDSFVRRLSPLRIVIAGAFTDVCVDATARTAFQKGFRVSVAADATLPLRRDQDETLDFMRAMYDAETPLIAEIAQLAQA